MNFAELADLALLGTDRQGVPAPAAANALGRLQSRVDRHGRERALLSLAALTGLHERVGALPARDTAPVPAVCPAESLARANEQAASLLWRLLADEFAELLPEWLALAAQAKLLAPPEALPALLAAGLGSAELREIILPVLGERGRWLAAQNPDWAWVTGGAEEDENIWRLGEGPARLLYLQRLRRTNPGRAIKLLAETWKEEPPEDRTALVAALELGLSPADEPFLETVLGDKRKEVRRHAAVLLSRLPDSALARRMIVRVRPLLKFVPKSGAGSSGLEKAGAAIIQVTLPAECDKTTQRDGVDLKPPTGTGEKAWWLMQMIESVPLDFWLREWNATRVEILTATTAGEWNKELFEAWSRAAIRQNNGAWTEVLFALAVENNRFEKVEGLLGAMPVAQREAALTRLFSADASKALNLPAILLAQCRHHWSPAFSRAVLEYLRSVIARESGDWQLRNEFKLFAVHLAPEVLYEARGRWSVDSQAFEFWSKGVNDFLAVIQFRSDLHNALKPSSTHHASSITYEQPPPPAR